MSQQYKVIASYLPCLEHKKKGDIVDRSGIVNSDMVEYLLTYKFIETYTAPVLVLPAKDEPVIEEVTEAKSKKKK